MKALQQKDAKDKPDVLHIFVTSSSQCLSDILKVKTHCLLLLTKIIPSPIPISPQHSRKVDPDSRQPGQVQLHAGVMRLGGHFKLTISEINLYKWLFCQKCSSQPALNTALVLSTPNVRKVEEQVLQVFDVMFCTRAEEQRMEATERENTIILSVSHLSGRITICQKYLQTGLEINNYLG